MRFMQKAAKVSSLKYSSTWMFFYRKIVNINYYSAPWDLCKRVAEGLLKYIHRFRESFSYPKHDFQNLWIDFNVNDFL